MNTTPPSDVRLKTYQNPKYHTRWTPFTHNTHAPVWIPAPAWRHLLRPIPVGRQSLRPGPPRLPVPVLVLPLLPWLIPRRRVPVPVKRKKARAEVPNTSATGAETPAAAPESPAITTPTSRETMLPGESHEWLDNDGEGLFTEPPRNGKKRSDGKLEHGNTKWFQTNASHALANPLLTYSLVRTSLVTYPLIITPPTIWPGFGHTLW